jgi:iron only hydrogenase large subunit-like protein
VIKRYWAKKAGVQPEDVCMVSIMPCTAKKHEVGSSSRAGVSVECCAVPLVQQRGLLS